MVGTIIYEVGIIYDIGTINVRFYLLEIRYPYRYCRITQYPHSFCGYDTYSIGTIKCDINTIIYDVGNIQFDVSTI